MLRVDRARKILAEMGAPSTAQVSKLPALPASTTSTERRGKNRTARRREVGIEILLKISREYGKSLEWLLLGTG
jgi:hypothetical protein